MILLEGMSTALITNDAVVLGMLAMILGFVFWSEGNKAFAGFYKYVPALLLCYFIPATLNSLGVIDGHGSKLYFVASRFLLPTTLVLLCVSVDLKGIFALGPKALIMFLTGTFGIVIGGPIALICGSYLFPDVFGGSDDLWRGMTTVAGSWIGGGANQAAMAEIFEVDLGGKIFSAMATVDVIVANIWMAVLLFLAPKNKQIDEKSGADTKAIDVLKQKMEDFKSKYAKIPTLTDLMIILAVGFGATGCSHFMADIIGPFIGENYPFLSKFSLTSKFFWLIVIATSIGVTLSFTRANKLEGVGASRVGSAMLYVLVAAIGMHMDITALVKTPSYFVVGMIWMAIHAVMLLVVAKLVKAPLFFMAVGSQANVGGAASAPVVASAFHPSLAPVGVLLAVFGYAVGTGGAYLCGLLMQAASQG
jgi:uncharacterized membrane protein